MIRNDIVRASKLAQIAAIVAEHEESDSRIGAVVTLRRIVDVLGPECSICLRRHGLEVIHECE